MTLSNGRTKALVITASGKGERKRGSSRGVGMVIDIARRIIAPRFATVERPAFACRIRPTDRADERLEAAFRGFRREGVLGLRRPGALPPRCLGGNPPAAPPQGASRGDRPRAVRAAAREGRAGGGATPRLPSVEHHVRIRDRKSVV